MTELTYEIRRCNACGLRYPAQQGSAFSLRCPHCLGETSAVLMKSIHAEERTRTRTTGLQSGMRAVLLDNIRSAWNVGSILRSADGFGFGHAYICGITPTPENEAVTKTSLGAEEYVTWSYHKDAVQLAKGLKKEGWRVLTIEEDERAVELPSENRMQAEKTVLILGSEVTGVDPDLLDLSDEIFYIPMHGQKRSLNVAIAFSVAAFALVG